MTQKIEERQNLRVAYARLFAELTLHRTVTVGIMETFTEWFSGELLVKLWNLTPAELDSWVAYHRAEFGL